MTDAPLDLAARGEEVRKEFPGLPRGRQVLFDALIAAATPEQELTVSEWADRYRKVSPESGSPFPGDWRTDRVPYLRQPMDCLHPDHPARSVTCRWSAQTGKSEIGVNWFGFIVDRAPGSILTMLPSLDEAIKYNRVKLQPTIDASPKIRHRVRPENSRDELASTSAFKRFQGGFDQIVTASSSKGLQMISVRYLIAEEVSEYLKDVDGRGSPLQQGRARQKAYGDLAKELIVSTPGLAGDCLATESFDAGDRRYYYVPCPHCGAFHVLKYEAMQAPADATRGRVTFGCPACGGLIDQVSRPDMIAAGRWVPTRVEDGEAAVPDIIAADDIDRHAIEPCTGRVRQWQPTFALWAAYSPMESWGSIFARGEASRGDPVKERVFFQQDLGEPYDPSGDAPDWEKLVAVRRPWPRGVVPFPGAVLTGFIDVQGNRFEWGLWAWGPGFQGWLVDRGVIAHDYESAEGWAQIDQLTARRWPTSSGREIDVMSWGIDTGAFTQILYDRVAGRHALNATKGDNRPAAAPLKKTRADLRDSRGRAIAGRRLDLSLIGNFDLKLSVYEGLRSLLVGPDERGEYANGTLHLPDWIGEDELKQLTAEVLYDPGEDGASNAKRLKLAKVGDRREWRKRPHQPNEALDIAVGCRALAWGEGAGQISKNRWRELVAEAHGPETRPPDLFTAAKPTPAPIVAAPPPPGDDVFDRLAALNGN